MISVNKIGPHGAEKIAEALKVNKTLTSINLSREDLISLFCLYFVVNNVLVCEWH